MRAFIAIELPEELKEKIFAVGQGIAKKVDIKLVEKENLHLTLLFLGEISEEEEEKVVRELGPPAGGLRGFGEIKLRLGRTEIFPDKRKPHGIWINVEGEKEKLFSLYKKIMEGVLKAGIKLGEKQIRFSPHITIGRFLDGRCEVGSEKWVEKLEAGSEKAFSVKKVTFFQSKLSPKGPKYGKIAEFKVK